MKDKNKLFGSFGSLKRLKVKETSSEKESTVELFDENMDNQKEVLEEPIIDDSLNDETDELFDIINEDIPISETVEKEYIEKEEVLEDDDEPDFFDKRKDFNQEETKEEIHLFDEESDKTDELFDIINEDDTEEDFIMENTIKEESDETDELFDIINEDIPVSETAEKEYIEKEEILEDYDENIEDLLYEEDSSESFENIPSATDYDLDSNINDFEEVSENKSEEYLEEDPFETTKYDDFAEFDEFENNEIEEPFENSPENLKSEKTEEEQEDSFEPEFIYSEEEISEEYSGYYNNSEINSKRNRKKGKDSLLKILIGIVALGVIAGAAFGIKYFINNKDKFNKEEIPKETIVENINTEKLETPTPTTDVPNQAPSNVTPDLTVENDLKDIEETVDEKEEVSSFIQTFTGYIVDVNNTNIYVSDKLEADQLSLLTTDFESFIGGTDTRVFVEEITEEVEVVEETKPEENKIIIIGAPTTEETEEESEEETTEVKTETKISKIYHSNSTCEHSMQIDMKAVSLSSLTSEYLPCEVCGEFITTSQNTAIDYDYSTVPELSSIIYKKFNIDAEEIPSWVTIGSKVTISYMQNADTYLNDVIEISKAKTNANGPTNIVEEDALGTTTPSEDEDGFRTSEMNIFGADFEAIVAKINDRNKGKQPFTGNVLDDELELEVTGTRESVSSSINIGACEYVWIQILWKKNGDTKSIPEVEDVTVELQTPGGSLVNDSNLNQYGKKWINKKVINYVLKNPKTGNWKVLFTKDVGSYLGDVTIQAAPMTGFLQINKAAAKYTDGKLKCIWQATGISDDYCKVQIFAKNGNNEILLYSGNTIDDDIRTVDMVDIDAAKIAGNIYDIVIKVTDIDVSADAQKKITYQFITDEYVVENVEIPSMR